MFKIPSYSDIEKNEKEVSEKGAQLKLNLFQSKQKEIEESKKSNAGDNQPTTSARSMDVSPMKTKAADLDDDDLLLCNIDINEVIANKKPKLSEPQAPVVAAKPPQQQSASTFKKPEPKKQTPDEIGASSVAALTSSNALLVNSKQRGNPILKHIRNVPWRYSDTLVPDYSMGRNICALYLSMKYHLLNNEYIHERLRELGRAYELRVLLVLVDIKDTKHCLRELEKICILANLTLILAWSYEEAGRYLETYKAYENKGAEAIQEKSYTSSSSAATNNPEAAFVQQFTDFICTIKSINKTDASTLLQTFGSLEKISEASKAELSLVPGFGPKKVNSVFQIFRTPFIIPESEKKNLNDDE